MNINKFKAVLKGCGIFISFSIFYSCTSSSIDGRSSESGKITAKVNTFLGTAPLLDPASIGYTPPKDWRVWAGLTYPGSSLPNAMVQLSPITKYGSGAGYEYEDTIIHGFAHTNKGHWDLCNIPVLPATGKPGSEGKYFSAFSHDEEFASPGYYKVNLKSFNIEAELTSTLRTGFHRYNFSNENNKIIVFDLSRANNRVREWNITIHGDSALSGFQDVGEKVFFYAETDTSIDSLSIDKENSGHAIAYLKDGGNLVNLKLALSFVSEENAKKNFEAEAAGKNFDEVKMNADDTWEKMLSKIKIKGGTDKQQWVFYSSLYRSFLWPALRSDVNGDYFDANREVVNNGFDYYTIPALWDTYRNKLVLLTLLSPEVTGNVIRSMTDIGSKRGFMPTFFHGDHASPFITGAYLRGLRNFNVEEAYRLMLKNATEESRSRPFLNEYMEKGFISDPHIINPHVETKASAGVSKTLEYAYDDFAVALLAKELGDEENYEKMMKRSGNFKNVFDKSSMFMRGRLPDGSWITPFDPQYPYYEYMYREANAWHVSFFAPHNMKGLIEQYGSPEKFEEKLDSMYSLKWNPEHIARNVSSFIGQYCHGNQPGHEAPFAYHFIGKPEKSQKIIDSLLNYFYATGEHELALPGMDDAGEMSSWYVFAAMGIYPYSSAEPKYLVTTPLFDEIEITLDNGNKLFIRKEGKGRAIKNVKVNDKISNDYFVNHFDLFSNKANLIIDTE